MDAAVFEQVYGAFQDFHAYFAPLFGRREARDHSRHYLQALLVQSGERRNAENLSETVPASARVMQRFLAESPWDDDTVIGPAFKSTWDPGLDIRMRCGCWTAATSPSKGGNRREWPGSTAGGWARWPTARPECSWLMSARWGAPWWTKGFYLPESWTSDQDRCEAAGVPEERQGYRSKTQLALEMLQRALERGHLKAGWVAGDDAFGMSPSFREGLAALGTRYVLDVPAGFTVWPPDPERTSPAYQGRGAPRKPRLVGGQRRTMEERSDELPEEAWREITVAEGSQGPRSYRFSAHESASNKQAEARRNPLGHLPPEPGRQRTPLLPVQTLRRIPRWRPWHTWEAPGGV